MIKLLAIIASIQSAIGAAYPTLTNFNPTQFGVVPTNTPTQVISIVNGVLLTNAVAKEIFTAEGAFLLAGLQIVDLTNGQNNLNPYQTGTLHLSGNSPNPADSTISLSGGHGLGQILIIENLTEGFGFCLTNNTPQWDNPSYNIILPNGDWCPTHAGDSLWMRMDSTGSWHEVNRVFASSVTPSGPCNVRSYGAIGDGVADDTAAFQLAINSCASITVPSGRYKITDTLEFRSGVSMNGLPPNEKIWDTNLVGSTLVFYITNKPAIHFGPAAGQLIESSALSNLIIDGENSSGTSDGLFLDGTAGSLASVRGLDFSYCTFRNFPRYQIYMYDYIFDILFERCNAHNRARLGGSGNHIVAAFGSANTQLTFRDCWLSQVLANYWCYYGVAHDVRFVAGTVEANENANGVYVENLGINIIGTHFESYGSSLSSTAIQYVGTGGGFIAPSDVMIFGCGVRIGNGSSPTTPATGVTISGQYGGNYITTGGPDVHIVAGGSRAGTTILATGGTNGPVVLDERLLTDDVAEVVRLDKFDNYVFNTYDGFEFRGGTNYSVIYPAIRLLPERLIAWRDSTNGLNKAAFIGPNSTNALTFGAGNATCMWISEEGSASIGNPPDNATNTILDIQSLTKGVAVPRMTAAQRAAITSPPTGSLVTQEDITATHSVGLKTYDSGVWKNFLTSADTNYVVGSLYSYSTISAGDPGSGLGLIVRASDNTNGYAGMAFSLSGGGPYQWQQYWVATNDVLYWKYHNNPYITAYTNSMHLMESGDSLFSDAASTFVNYLYADQLKLRDDGAPAFLEFQDENGTPRGYIGFTDPLGTNDMILNSEFGLIRLISTDGTMLEGSEKLIFGSAGTNTLRRIGESLFYENVGAAPSIGIDNGVNDVAMVLTSTYGGLATTHSTLLLSGSDESFQLSGTNLTGSGVALGTANIPWEGLSIKSPLRIFGFGSGLADYSKLEITHGGTNDVIAYNSVSDGIAGAPRPHQFQFNGTNTYRIPIQIWEDSQVPAMAIVLGATAPSLENFNGGPGKAYCFNNNQDDEGYATIQMTHRYKQGSTVSPHVHWAETATTGAGTNIVWELAYAWGNLHEAFPSYTTVTITNNVTGTNWFSNLSSFPDVTGTDKRISSQFIFRIRRLASTATADNYDKDIAFLGFDLHYQVDSPGSDSTGTKSF